MNSNFENIEEISENLFFVAGSPVMRKLRMQAELVAKIDAPVLILGESGSGKEIVAKLIHKLSARSKNAFVTVNCGALPENVLEGELFGYEQGGVGAAARGRLGKFEVCHNGTILLDDITEIPPTLQAKLVHVLQERRFFRLGGDAPISADVRVMAATNVKVEQALTQRKLREDLYYRLSAFTVHVPGLRERKEEIPILLNLFMDRIAKHYSLKPRLVSPLLLQACQDYSWPGNLHELENIAKRYLVMGDEFVEVGDLGVRSAASREPEELLQDPVTEPATGDSQCEHPDSGDLKHLVRSIKGETERNAISSTLDRTHWNPRAAARELGISYRGLLYKIQEYELIPPNGYLSPLTKNGIWRRGPSQ